MKRHKNEGKEYAPGVTCPGKKSAPSASKRRSFSPRFFTGRESQEGTERSRAASSEYSEATSFSRLANTDRAAIQCPERASFCSSSEARDMTGAPRLAAGRWKIGRAA